MIIPIFLAGGSGCRLWPLSRSSYSKQFHPLYSDESLFQDSLNRLQSIINKTAIIVCGRGHRFIAVEQTQEIDAKTQLLIEPCSKNTLSAITVASFAAMENEKNNPIILVLPSDHLIQDVSKFTKAISTAAELIESDQIITFGIEVARAETGYGYLKVGKPVGKANKPSENTGVLLLDSFVEKPPQDIAKNFMECGEYLGNSGMFMARANTIIELVKTYQPENYHHCKDAFNKSKTDLDFVRLEEKAYSRCEAFIF